MPIRVTVWNEHIQDASDPRVINLYPDGIHGALSAGLHDVLGDAVAVRTATLGQPEHGLTEAVLASTDVLVWWAHLCHDEVSDSVVERVVGAVLSGTGLVVLHSGQGSRVFRRLMGTSCSMAHNDAGVRELLWTVSPRHQIVRHVPNPVVIPQQETYGEFFDIPTPDELIFISSFEGGEVFRSGCCFIRGFGRIFYFGPGHEDFPVFYQPEVRRIIANAVLWAAPGVTESGAH